MTSTKRPATHFAFLGGMRGFAALYVVLHHCLAWLAVSIPKWAWLMAVPFGFGHTSVSVFIVLSGFSLMLPIASDPEHRLRGGKRGFFQRRARRILPPYYAALALSVAALLLQDKLYGTVTSATDLPLLTGSVAQDRAIDVGMHTLLFHNLSPRWNGSINVTFWSIATEWQLYFTLPFLLLPLWLRFGQKVMIMAAVIIGIALPVVIPALGGACHWYLGLFAFGAAAATLVPRLSELTPEQAARFHSHLRLLLGAAALSYVAVSVVPESRVPFSFFPTVKAALKDTCIGGAVAVALLYGVLHTFAEAKRRSGGIDEARSGIAKLGHAAFAVLESRLGNFLARFSYSLYLTHFIILNAVMRYGAAHAWSPLKTWCWRTFFCVPVALGFGYLFFLLFERPFLTGNRGTKGKRDVAPTGVGLPRTS